MTGLLLDTHAVLWWYAQSEKLPLDVREALVKKDEQVWVSAVSAYEITLKNRVGKLPGVEGLIDDFSLRLVEDGFRQLPISCRHALTAGGLRLTLRDPFDRLLIAQALTDNLRMVTREAVFEQYGVRRFW